MQEGGNLHFIITGPNFKYMYYIAILTAIKAHKPNKTIIWATIDVRSKYLDLLRDKIEIRRISVPQFPALQGKPDHYVMAHTKDYLTYKVLYEEGGICLDLDTVSIEGIADLLGEKEMVVPSDYEDGNPIYCNSAILVGRKGSSILREARDAALKILNGDKDSMVWGDTGPKLVSKISIKYPDKVHIPAYGVCGGYGGHHIHKIYEQAGVLEDHIRVVHLFAVYSDDYGFGFSKIDSEWVGHSRSLLAKTIRSLLTVSEWNPSPKFFVEIGSNYFNTLVNLAKEGWSGIVVEPVTEYFNKIERVDGVIYENVAIGDFDREGYIYYIPEETIKSEGLPEWAKGIGCLNRMHPLVIEHKWEKFVRKDEIAIITMRTLLNRHNIKRIDYLKIDAEGNDCSILKQVDVSKIGQITFEHKHCPDVEVGRELDRLRNNRFKYTKVGDNIDAIKRRYRFHLPGLAHIPQHKRHSVCAFTQKNVKLSKMLMSLGHEVFFYGSEGSEVECSEFIQTHTIADIRADYGDGNENFDLGYDWTKDNRHDLGTERKPSTLKFYDTCIREINKRKDPNDFLLMPLGYYHKPIMDAVGLNLCCETGVGYPYGCCAPYRAFESLYIQSFTYGSENPHQNRIGSHYDRIIPNYFDEEDVEFSDQKEDYYFFISRIFRNKGTYIAYETCLKTGIKLIIAGQGAYVDNRGHLISTVDGSDIGPGNWEYIGFVDIPKRKKLMAHARATFTPTEYLEPFGGTHIESMLSGTPVITTDFGVFPQTVQNGVNGYKCHTLQDFVDATEDVKKLDPKVVRQSAEKYLSQNVRWEFQKWFDDLYEVQTGKGWYALRD